MRAHVVDFQFLRLCEWRIRLAHFFDKPHVSVVFNPFGEIVEALHVGNISVAVAQESQIAAEVGEGRLFVLGAKRQRHHILHVGGAIELREVDDEPFLREFLQGLGYVGDVEQLASEVNHQIVAGLQLLGGFQQFHHFCAIAFRV